MENVMNNCSLSDFLVYNIRFLRYFLDFLLHQNNKIVVLIIRVLPNSYFITIYIAVI